MKKWIIILFVPFTLVSCEKDIIIPESDLPSEITGYLEEHFPDHKMIQAIKERDGLELSWQIILEGSFLLEFNRQKEITDIEGITKLPDSVIPEKILDYTSENYPDHFINGWEKDDLRQKVTLDNGLELEFSKSGEFLMIEL